MDAAIRIVVATLTLAGSVSWCSSTAQIVDLSVHGFRSDVTVPISDLTRRSLEYGMMHSSQSTDMDFSACVVNEGPDTAFSVAVSCHVLLDGDEIGSFLSDTIQQLLPGTSDTVIVDADLDVSAMWNELSLCFQVASAGTDTITSNDSDTLKMMVEDGYFLRSEREWNDTMTCGTMNELTMILVRYEILEESMTCGIACVIPVDTTLEFEVVIGGLYDEDLDLIATTNDGSLNAYNMSEPGEAHLISLYFQEFVELVPGHDYYAAIGFFEPMHIATNGPCADSSGFKYHELSDTWTPLQKTPLIGLYMGCYGSVEEHASEALALGPPYPDPAAEHVALRFTLREAGTPSIELRSCTGALVLVKGMGHKGPGDHRIDLDVSSLPAGVYSFSLAVDGSRATRTVVVAH